MWCTILSIKKKQLPWVRESKDGSDYDFLKLLLETSTCCSGACSWQQKKHLKLL
jgi:hypothetical protein